MRAFPPAERRRAILLLGPTGSGKTPLGRLLEKEGWRGRRCVHFDFGAALRDAADRPSGEGILEERERDVIRASLRDGTLLEDDHFPIALKILDGFAARRRIGRDDLVILNGLPRHAGQAAGLASRMRIEAVIVLEAGADMIRERIRRDVGGDRAGRADDSEAEVARKLEVFRTRTLPLAAHYRSAGVPVVRVAVGADTRPEDVRRLIAAALGEDNR